MKYLLFLIPLLAFSMDEFERDLAKLKSKYIPEYEHEEISKWKEILEKEHKPTFSEKFHEIFRHLDLSVFLNYYVFHTNFQPDGEIHGVVAAAGPDLDMQLMLWKAFDLYIYGNYGITKPASFVETYETYPVPNNFLVGLGSYFFNTPPKVSTYFSFEFQKQSFVGLNQNLDYSTVNVFTQLSANQVTSLNVSAGMDVPLRIFSNDGVFRAYITPSILAVSDLENGTFTQNISQFQYGAKFRYFYHNQTLVEISYKGGFYRGESEQTYNFVFLNFGYRF